MKNCENCGVPQEKRPGCIRDCIYNGHHRISMNFAGWRPKKPEKTCGNCGWFINGKLKYNPNYGTCLNKENGWHNTTLSNRRVDDIDCKCWKPIVCKTCGGTGTVCYEHCEFINTNCRHSECGHRDLCPTCQPKEERLMMPVRWDNYHESNVLIAEIQEEEYFSTWVAKCVSEHSKWKVYVNSRDFGETKLPIEFHEREEAIQAIEKALRIERK